MVPTYRTVFVMQIGTNTNDVAWEFLDANGFDEEMLDWYRIYTRLHLRLFPMLGLPNQSHRQDGRHTTLQPNIQVQVDTPQMYTSLAMTCLLPPSSSKTHEKSVPFPLIGLIGGMVHNSKVHPNRPSMHRYTSCPYT